MYIGIYMKFLVLESHDSHLNLATEEYLFNNLDGELFMLWQNAPTVVIGKSQNVRAEINSAYINENGVKLARRITGGGAVYHDLGNLNYTFISDRAEEGIDFAFFTAPIISALESMGVNVSLTGRNDLVTDTGAKISGNAQYSRNGRVLHHGTLLFSSDLDALSLALKVDEEKIKSKAIKSTRSRVTNISDLLDTPMSMQEFIDTISGYIIKTYSPEIISPPSPEQVADLYAKYSSDDWLYPTSTFLSGYTVTKKKRYPFGSVELSLAMDGERISGVRIYGDFFGTKPTEELEQLMIGKGTRELVEAIDDIPVGDYINGMTRDDLISLIES